MQSELCAPEKIIGVLEVLPYPKAGGHEVAAQRGDDAMPMRSELGCMDAIPEIAWTARYNGHIDCLNRKWYEYKGLRHAADVSSEALEARW